MSGPAPAPSAGRGRRRPVRVLVLLAGLALVVLAAVLLLRGTRDAGGPVPSATPSSPATTGAADRPVDLVVATFNVLGSTHTTPRGNRPGLASGVERVRGVVELLRRHDVDVAGFQEVQPDQRAAFRSDAPGWALVEGRGADPRSGENAVAYRRDTWSAVRTRMFAMPDTGGAVRPVPVLVLRHRATGRLVEVVTFHNPADTRRFPDQQAYREQATEREVQLARQAAREGLPLVVTGDMNERAGFFCRFAPATRMRATVGGSVTATWCRPPVPSPVDWVFVSSELRVRAHVVDDGAMVRRTTDHRVVVAELRLEPSRRP